MLPTALDGAPCVWWLMPWRRAMRGWSRALRPRRRGGAGRLRRKHRREQTAQIVLDCVRSRSDALLRYEDRMYGGPWKCRCWGRSACWACRTAVGATDMAVPCVQPHRTARPASRQATRRRCLPAPCLKKINETPPATGNASRFFRYRGIRKPHAGFSEPGTECAHQGKPMARSVPFLILYFIY